MITGLLLSVSVGICVGIAFALHELPWWLTAIVAGCLGAAFNLACAHIGLP